YIYYSIFQAEDGIRDRNVTGVQTCALPILQHGQHHGSDPGPSPQAQAFADTHFQFHAYPSTIRKVPSGRGNTSLAERSSSSLMRSEERRVGKESRQRR